MKTCPLETRREMTNLVLHEGDEGGYDQRDAWGIGMGLGVEVGWELVAEGFARTS